MLANVYPGDMINDEFISSEKVERNMRKMFGGWNCRVVAALPNILYSSFSHYFKTINRSCGERFYWKQKTFKLIAFAEPRLRRARVNKHNGAARRRILCRAKSCHSRRCVRLPTRKVERAKLKIDVNWIVESLPILFEDMILWWFFFFCFIVTDDG